MRQKTYLFFPVEIGLAHIVRGLAVGEALVSRGHRVFFALPKSKHHLFRSSTVTLIDIGAYISAFDTVNVREFSNHAFLKPLVAEEIALIKKYRPDCLVIDFRISALAAGLITKTPVFSLSLGESLPYGSRLPNPGFPQFLYRFLHPMVGPIYHAVLLNYLKPLMQIVREYGVKISFDSWFHEISWILSEPSFYFPPYNKTLPLTYVGPLSWNGFANKPPSWLSRIRPDGRTVYLTFGGTGFDRKKLISLSVLLVKNGYRVIVSSSTIADPGDFPALRNLYVARFLPGKDITKRVDLMICHGGYGTMIEAVENMTPVLALPFNPDQILHGWRMQELGVARCLFAMSFPDLKEIFTFNWGRIEDKGRRLPIKTILEETRLMFSHYGKYKKALLAFNEKYPSRDGAAETALYVERQTK